MKAISRMVGTFSVMGVRQLPFSVLKVTKDTEGKRVIEGVKAFVDSLPEIPMGRRVGSGEWMPYSRTEREAMAAEIKAKAERVFKKEAKAEAYEALPIVERAKIEAKKATEKIKRAAKKAAKASPDGIERPARVIRPIHKDRPIIGAGENYCGKPKADELMTFKRPNDAPLQTVKRDGKWIQVGIDALTAHIEAR